MFASELSRMGADVVIDDHHALVHGVKGLQGAPVVSTDLRAGGALVLAGLIAEGETIVRKISHIDRGGLCGQAFQLGCPRRAHHHRGIVGPHEPRAETTAQARPRGE